MIEISSAPDLSALDVPVDAWTAPFWQASAAGQLLLPACGECQRFRWPPGPFCPHCQSQHTEWRDPGPAQLYSYTILRERTDAGEETIRAPALVEFPQADGVRILAALTDAPIDDIRIGATLQLRWSKAANVTAPVFTLASGEVSRADI